jgi:8-oxo-dGTP pyrophosphatase MutT (NUDIX family)
MVGPWKRIESRTIAEHRIFGIREDSFVSPRTGRTHAFTILDSPDWTNVIALTPESEVVLIHQFRHGIGDLTLEIPGGMADPEDASIEETARRELREETGYEAERMVSLGHVTPNPAFLNNRCHTFLAAGARKTGPATPEGSEDIEVEVVPLAEIPQLIETERITHALVIAAFYLLDRYRKRDGEALLTP